MKALEKYQKFLSDKKVQKQIEKAHKKIEKHQFSIEQKKTVALQKSKEDIMSKYEKQHARFLSKANRELEKQIRKAIWRNPLKKKERSMKQKAFAEFQKYCRLVRCNPKTWLLTLIDTWETVKRNDKKVNAWHYYPKHNFPHFAFSLLNCRPISRQCNRMQGDNVGLRRRPQLLAVIWTNRLAELESEAENKLLKNEIRDNNYYQQQYDKYHTLNKSLLLKLVDNGVV